MLLPQDSPPHVLTASATSHSRDMADSSELTSHPAVPLVDDPSRFSESKEHKKYSPVHRYIPNTFSGAYRLIRELPSVKLSRSPSLLDLKNTSPGFYSANSPTISAGGGISITADSSASQHIQKLDFQSSLAKPLPRPPILRADSAPPQCSGIASNLRSVLGGQVIATSDVGSLPIAIRPKIGSRTSNIGSDTPAPQTHLPGIQVANDSTGSLSRAARSSPEKAQGPSASVGGPPQGSSTRLSGLVCNVHRTTGHGPHALVGATTTILGDRLYVFGGRTVSGSTPGPLTSDLHELDLVRRHWTKLETTGDIPIPRYFHSMCALGDTKMVCYGGMSLPPNQPAGANQQQPETIVMSDVYIYDVHTRVWTFIPSQNPPQGRYAHCACILPSSATFASQIEPLSALQHKSSNGSLNRGRIGINHVSTGGAEMVIVGGQDGRNNYIEQVNIFNFRSLEWTSTQLLKKGYGAYRSMTAPLTPAMTAKIDCAHNEIDGKDRGVSRAAQEPRSAMLIYSNYNFLDVKLELQIRSPEGMLSEKPMSGAGAYAPPGLRFPNGGVINTHLLVSGAYLTSSKQEYALWALDLRSLAWSRIDAGGSILSQGSWNRGVVWNRRNAFVVLGNQKRNLVNDYDCRRINFSNICVIDLEAFGFYDNPCKTSPGSDFISASSPLARTNLGLACNHSCLEGGRVHSRASEELGRKAFALRELADMDILCVDGERIPVNSRIVGRRWGPYFAHLLREGAPAQDRSDAIALYNDMAHNALQGLHTTTIAPSPSMSDSRSMNSTTGSPIACSRIPPKTAASIVSGSATIPDDVANPIEVHVVPTPRSSPPNSRSRCLYLPHTYLTTQALLHFLYTSSLPPQSSPLCTLQILCSLLQIARPYRVDGLLEAVIERLHIVFDSRNAAAIFSATAMAAGGGRGIEGLLNPNLFSRN
ncbi:hypothetical protein BFJ63_vAg17004 [Fusarium oxysporum f. sp. narcissi]|uniref:Protein ral2 n=1 Tax=Fusarium oxysporum f. sp. narcissi TaxID=451672 RepID=A0A4Q2V1V2_FUSOX|nr:hypothetical protein BFJ63_vAg17004 [Fusarium oxysporum f. sp. narcissi]